MTIKPDGVNACLEFGGALMVLNHCRAVLRDKMVAGVSILSVLFFNAWGFWNLFYYPYLGQTWSFIGGCAIVTANTVWVLLLLTYRNRR